MAERNLYIKAVLEILGSHKYAGVDRQTVERICAEFSPRYKSQKDVVKAVKKELHIIYGSFLGKNCHEQAELLISSYPHPRYPGPPNPDCVYPDAVKPDKTNPRAVNPEINTHAGDIFTDREFAARLLGLHASTAERLGALNEIFAMFGEYITGEDAVVDIGCGFNPFSLPYFPDKPRSYIAYDIDARTTALINTYFAPLGPGYAAKASDAVIRTPDNATFMRDTPPEAPPEAAQEAAPDVPTDTPPDAPQDTAPDVPPEAPPEAPPDAPSVTARVVFMLKLFPLLERQKKGRAFELLDTMVYNTAIVSFPTKSASGRDRGMEAFYSVLFENGLPPRLKIIRKEIFCNEMFYIIKRRVEWEK